MRLRQSDRVHHPLFGLGTVTEVTESGRVEVIFDSIGKKWIALKHVELRVVSPEEEAQIKLAATGEPSETFAPPDEDGRHAHGSHWAIFFDDVGAFLGATLPMAINNSGTVPCWGENRPAPYELPADEPGGTVLIWPIPRQGMLMVIELAQGYGPNKFISAYPWFCEGTQHRILLEQVYPWDNRLEAQIKATVGDMSITFFDPLYAQHKGFYKAGKTYQFILSGFAYFCAVVEAKPFLISDPETIRIFRSTDEEDQNDLSPITIQTKGMAAFFPVEEWDRDEYQFQAPVKQVTETALFEEKTWRIRGTIGHHMEDDSDIDLDIYVPEKSLRGGKIPKAGDDISGTLWLQGYLWYPEPLTSQS